MLPANSFKTLVSRRDVKGIIGYLKALKEAGVAHPEEFSNSELLYLVLQTNDDAFFEEFIQETGILVNHYVYSIVQSNRVGAAVATMKLQPISCMKKLLDNVISFDNSEILEAVMNINEETREIVGDFISDSMFLKAISMSACSVLETLVKNFRDNPSIVNYEPKFRDIDLRPFSYDYHNFKRISLTCKIIHYMGARDFDTLAANQKLCSAGVLELDLYTHIHIARNLGLFDQVIYNRLVKYRDPMVLFVAAWRANPVLGKIPLCLVKMIRGFQLELLHGF